MGYQIKFRAVANDHFAALDGVIKRRVAAAIDKLTSEPRPPRATLLIGMPGVRRIRIGDYRVLYTVDDETSEIWVEDVRHRGKAYRRR